MSLSYTLKVSEFVKHPECGDDVDDGGGIVTGTHIADGNLGV